MVSHSTRTYTRNSACAVILQPAVCMRCTASIKDRFEKCGCHMGIAHVPSPHRVTPPVCLPHEGLLVPHPPPPSPEAARGPARPKFGEVGKT